MVRRVTIIFQFQRKDRFEPRIFPIDRKIYLKCYSKSNIDRRGFSVLLLYNNKNRLLITKNIKYIKFYRFLILKIFAFVAGRCKIRVATADQRFQLTRFICFFFPPGLINPLLIFLFLIFSFVPVASYLLLSFSRVNSLLGTRSRGAPKNTEL